jgi:putative photosynthetic complex assembly protein 2
VLEASLPALFAIFVWWFSTGLVLLLDGLPRTTFRWSVFISTVLCIAAFFGMAQSASQSSVVGAYCAFTCALLVWAWHELTFLTGWLTGPRKQPSPAGIQGWARFSQAVAAILWHELGILTSGLLIVGITWNAPNQVGTWTFMVLWAMRTSAKLNLFLGVRNLSEEFLPPHLAYMESFFRRRAMNLLFPFSVGSATLVLIWLLSLAFSPTAPAGLVVGLMLVATMLAMAVLEHFLLVLPLPTTALWRWALRNRPPTPSPVTAGERTAKESLIHAR